jgi:hypothetical protein
VPPVTNDPAHPFVPNGVGKQPTFRIADLSNPNLKPWVKERICKHRAARWSRAPDHPDDA